MKTLLMWTLEHPVIAGAIILLVLASLLPILLGAGFIPERQVGVVVKKFASHPLPPGRLIPLPAEAGNQAEPLWPGLHFGNFGWPCSVFKAPVTILHPC